MKPLEPIGDDILEYAAQICAVPYLCRLMTQRGHSLLCLGGRRCGLKFFPPGLGKTFRMLTGDSLARPRMRINIESQRSISAHRLSAARSIPLAPLSAFALSENIPQTPYTRLAYCPMLGRIHGHDFNGRKDNIASALVENGQFWKLMRLRPLGVK
jgi:hypothetical protein